jgi:TfoX/Sxy family transcriptional regulator of competence genes
MRPAHRADVFSAPSGFSGAVLMRPRHQADMTRPDSMLARHHACGFVGAPPCRARSTIRRYTPPTMPKFEKSPPELVARFGAVSGRHPTAQLRPMFGYPALFVDGNYACGLFAERWVVRLAPADLAAALALPGAAAFSPMPGRAMTGWASLPADVVVDDERLDDWVRRAIAFAASLPAKR